MSIGRPLTNLVGQKYHRLTVLSYVGKVNERHMWACLCDCGTEKVIASGDFKKKTNPTQSCGCVCAAVNSAKATTHGHHRNKTPTREYRTWKSMIARTTNANIPGADRYILRGITVCDRWLKFENFLDDMGPRPRGMSLDRIDNDLGYFADNCRWATARDQANNRSNTHRVLFRGEFRTIRQIADQSGLPLAAIRSRIHKGIEPEQAIAMGVTDRNRPKSRRLRDESGKFV